MTDPDVRIQLLGGLTVVVGHEPVDGLEWRRRQAAALVKVLALTPGRSMHRERLIDVLWPDLDVDAAAPRLHKAAHYARRALGDPGSVVLGGDVVELFPQRSVLVDASEFESAAAQALAAQDVLEASTAADLYRGDLLPEDPYEPWAEQPRERLRLLQLDLLRLAARWAEVVAMEPTDEEAHLTIARTLASSGDSRGALRQLERLEGELRHELGVAPSRAVIELRDQLLAQAAPPTIEVDASIGVHVGRKSECHALVARLPDGQTRSGGAVFVSGLAGVGKTTMLRWVQDEAIERGLAVGVGVAAQVEGEWPYAPVLEALSELCRRYPDALEALSANLRSEIEEAISGRTTTWDGQGAHQRLYVAASELVRAAARERGVVLVVDHAHDADQASLMLLHYLVRAVAEVPAVIVLGHRPVTSGQLADLRSGLLSRGKATAIDLRPLGREDSYLLASTVLPDASQELLETIYQKSGGLPFGVVELARDWRQRDHATDAPMAWIPPGLSPSTVRAVSRSAVLGMSFDTDEFEHLTELDDDHAFAAIDDALAHRVIGRSPTGYRFRHSLIRDSFLDVLSVRERALAHEAAAVSLASLDRSPARVGHHYVEAGLTSRAVPWLLAAAETEAAHGAYRDALITVDRVLPAAEGFERTQLFALRADLLNACADARAVDAYRQALATTDAESEGHQRAKLLIRLARAATSSGDLDTAELALAELELDGSDNDPELLLARGTLAFQQQDYTAADEAASEARQMIGLAGEPWQLFDLIALQGLLAHLRGEWFQRLRVELRNTVESPQTAVGIFDSHLCVAEFLLYGPTPYDEVLALAEQLRASAEEAGVLRAVAFATALRGEAALLKGDLELAETELLDSVDLHHDLGSQAGEAHSLQRLAEVHLARGDLATAQALLNRALPLARWSPIAPHLLQRIYGSLILAAPDPAAAFAVVERAESTLANEDDCQLCTIMLDLPAARASAAVGDTERTRRYLESAELSADRWEGTAWHAAVLELQAFVAHSDGHESDAQRLLTEAETLFEASGQPLDAARCRAGFPAVESSTEPSPAR